MFAYYLHDLNPLIFRIYDNVGPRWYGLAYVLAFISGYLLFLWLAKRGFADLPTERVGDFITGCALFGVIIGGRLGYVFFYKPEMLREPLSILRVWEGGMSSHGGIFGLLAFTFSTRIDTKFRGRISATIWSSLRRLDCFLDGAPISSTASCTGASQMCRGQCNFQRNCLIILRRRIERWRRAHRLIRR